MNNQKWERTARKNRRIAITLTILLHLGLIGGIYYSLEQNTESPSIKTVETASMDADTKEGLKP